MIKESKNKVVNENDYENKTYTCPVCGKTNLKTSRGFNLHMLREHGRSYPINNIKGGSA